MSRKLIEKLTGSMKLTTDELADLNRPQNVPGPKLEATIGSKAGATLAGETTPPPKSIFPAGTTLTQGAAREYTGPLNEVVEEVSEDELDFELPPDDEIETIEEVVEDDNIDEEQVDEYYEVIDEGSEEEPDEEKEESTRGEYPTFEFHEETDAEESAARKRERSRRHEELEDEHETVSLAHINGNHELPIDIYEIHHELIIRTLIPGITPENLKVSITRDHVTISGDRPAIDAVEEDAYYTRELSFGTFHRTIILPVEVDVERAEAVEKFGMLIIRLPKVDSKKSQELKVRSA